MAEEAVEGDRGGESLQGVAAVGTMIPWSLVGRLPLTRDKARATVLMSPLWILT